MSWYQHVQMIEVIAMLSLRGLFIRSLDVGVNTPKCRCEHT